MHGAVAVLFVALTATRAMSVSDRDTMMGAAGADMSKLDEYIQADKANEANVDNTPQTHESRAMCFGAPIRDPTCWRTHADAAPLASTQTESLYSDLQGRFSAINNEWQRAEVERKAMRRALQEAREHVQTLTVRNERLNGLMAEVRAEHLRLSSARSSLMQALGMDGKGLNLTASLQSA